MRLDFSNSVDRAEEEEDVPADTRDQLQLGDGLGPPAAKARRTELCGASPNGSGRSEEGAGDEEAAGEVGGEAQAEGPPPTTPFVKEALVQLHERRDNLYRQLEDANLASMEFLDSLKVSVSARLGGLQKEIQAMCENVEQELLQASTATLDVQERLAAARHLVQTLGIRVTHRGEGQQE